MTDDASQPSNVPELPMPVEPEPDAAPSPLPTPEVGGRKGLDPTRFGDWENKGIAVDF
jgi:hypothetical protein